MQGTASAAHNFEAFNHIASRMRVNLHWTVMGYPRRRNLFKFLYRFLTYKKVTFTVWGVQRPNDKRVHNYLRITFVGFGSRCHPTDPMYYRRVHDLSIIVKAQRQKLKVRLMKKSFWDPNNAIWMKCSNDIVLIRLYLPSGNTELIKIVFYCKIADFAHGKRLQLRA